MGELVNLWVQVEAAEGRHGLPALLHLCYEQGPGTERRHQGPFLPNCWPHELIIFWKLDFGLLINTFFNHINFLRLSKHVLTLLLLPSPAWLPTLPALPHSPAQHTAARGVPWIPGHPVQTGVRGGLQLADPCQHVHGGETVGAGCRQLGFLAINLYTIGMLVL